LGAQLKRPIIALAPMADYTDEPFSLICKKFGADLIFREMISAEAIVRGNEKTLQMTKINSRERPVIAQIFGSIPKVIAEAAKIIEKKFRPEGIDINMGCPVRKIVGIGAGCELMRKPRLAAEIVRAVKSAVKISVSVKTRLGWTKETDILEFAPILEAAGADFITVHGRTREQGYGGKANWEMIGRVKKLLKIPVILNGGIWNAGDAKRALSFSGADGVAIARGALGNPWIFQEIKTGDIKKDIGDIKDIVLEHLRLHLKHYGERGIVTFRKHLVFYFRGFPNAKELRVRLARIESEKELNDILASLPFQTVV